MQPFFMENTAGFLVFRAVNGRKTALVEVENAYFG